MRTTTMSLLSGAAAFGLEVGPRIRGCVGELLPLAAARSAANYCFTAIKVDFAASATAVATSVADCNGCGPIGGFLGTTW